MAIYSKGPSINYVVSVGGRGRGVAPKTIYYILRNYLIKKTTRGQKWLILRRHSLWTAPYGYAFFKLLHRRLKYKVGGFCEHIVPKIVWYMK